MPPKLRHLTVVHAQPEEGLPPWHRHDVHELLYLARGRYEVDVLGARRQGDAGWVFCHPAGRPHRPRAVGEGRFSRLEAILVQWEEDTTDPWPYPLIHQDASGRLFAILDWMLDLQRRDTAASRVSLERLFPLALEELAASTDRRQFLLLSVHTFVMDNLPHPLRVADLADAAGLSRFHFIRQFRKVSGQTPQAYVMTQRVEAAVRLVKSTELTLAEISARTGFCSAFHLSKRLKQHLGVSPRALRSARTGG